ncbi:MAG: hypothetical protein IBX71_02495 [Candidatus Desulforudis sp.]|nr:hypothetical protein [Desulforudis sp.]
MILGEFKRGKSTFINALLGENEYVTERHDSKNVKKVREVYVTHPWEAMARMQSVRIQMVFLAR